MTGRWLIRFLVRAVFLAFRWSPSSYTLTWWTEEAQVSSYQALMPSWETYPHDLSKPHYLPKVSPPNTIKLGVRASA